jgi:thioredoxin-related protein
MQNNTVKKGFLIAVLLACSSLGFAQADTSLLYLRYPSVPKLSIFSTPDSIKNYIPDLAKDHPTLIMVFSPDCGHCQEKTKDLLAHISLFKQVRIIMASPLLFSDIRRFYYDYRIAGYPNITLGMDPGYFLGNFFHVRMLPSLFLYDKNGNFVKKFDGNDPADKIAEAL